MIQTTIMDSPIGELFLAQSNKGLTHILFEYEISKSESIIKENFPKVQLYMKRKNFPMQFSKSMNIFPANANPLISV
jgi:6-O-methylguanine DNA methyltransferase, ribonuclease-like domain.